MLSAEADEVCITPFKRLFGKFGIVDAAHPDHRNIHKRLYGPGPEQVEPCGRVHGGYAQAPGRGINTNGNVQCISPGIYQLWREPLHEFQVEAAPD